MANFTPKFNVSRMRPLSVLLLSALVLATGMVGCDLNKSPADSDLSGTWDTLDAEGDTKVTVEMRDKFFKISFCRQHFNFLNSQEVRLCDETYTYSVDESGDASVVKEEFFYDDELSAPVRFLESPVDIARTRASFSAGGTPIDVGGLWTFTDPEVDRDCTVNLSRNSFVAACEFGDFGFGWTLPHVLGTANGTRTEKLDSIFGDFGGKWTVVSAGGIVCTTTIQSRRFKSTCSNGESADISLDEDLEMGSGTIGGSFDADSITIMKRSES